MARRQLKHSKKKPLVVICSEGGKKSSEYYYFRNFASRDLRIQFSTGNSTDPKGMLEDLKKYIVNEDIKSEDNCRIFLVLDTDLSDKRISEIKEIEQECNNNNIEIITSAPTFEVWYLMHYRKNKPQFHNAGYKEFYDGKNADNIFKKRLKVPRRYLEELSNDKWLVDVTECSAQRPKNYEIQKEYYSEKKDDFEL